MRNELTEIELIERYLEGKLAGEERAAFEKKLSGQNELSEVVELQRMMMERVGVLALKDIIREVHVKRTGNGLNFSMSIVILLIGIGSMYATWSYFRSPVVSERTTVQSKIGSQAPVVVKPAPVIVKAKETVPVKVAVKSTSSIRNTGLVNNPKKTSVPKAVVSVPPKAATPVQPVNVPAKEEEAVPSPDLLKQNFTVPFNKYSFNAEKGGDFTYAPSGSRMIVPPNALMRADGKSVSGNVELNYREFRDAADMTFSGIPMTYGQGEREYNFNSAGMFELYALQGNDSLYMKAGYSVRVDFALTQQIPDLAFYQLDKERKNWSEIGGITPQPVDTASNRNKGSRFKIKMEKNPVYRGEEKASLPDSIRRSMFFYANPNLKKGEDTLAYNVYSVRGLLCEDFRVYNCDQVYRIKNAVQINPTFRDSSGKIIGKQLTLTLIDLNYNNAFNFDPSTSFKLDRKGKNVLVLFTNDNRIFTFGKEKFSQADIRTGKNEFTMSEVTQTLKNTKDLRGYLGLKK